MKILFVAAEAAPLVKVGGLADVIGALPKALLQLGHDVRIAIPRYKIIDSGEYKINKTNYQVDVVGNVELQTAELEYTWLNNVVVYLIRNSIYFHVDEIYSTGELDRFLFFSRAVVDLLPLLDWQPDIIHAHDWHTALIPMWVKSKNLSYKTVFTIHNLAYQGTISKKFLASNKLEKYWQTTSDGQILPLNFMAQGILQADMVTTVSQTYAKQILTAEFGMGMNKLLKRRENSFIGITNGIDSNEYNPDNDPYIYANYNSETVARKTDNKLALQSEVKLPVTPDVPLIGMIQRLEEQKGIDIFEKAVDDIMERTDVQIVILGLGQPHYEQIVKDISSRYPERIAGFISFDNVLAHKIYAGSDMFLMPSFYEPCGLGQLIAMRYGALPVVRHTGGLVDTVTSLARDLKTGSGFIFLDYSSKALVSSVVQGAQIYRSQELWNSAVKRVMNIDFSWSASAHKYEKMYETVLGF